MRGGIISNKANITTVKKNAPQKSTFQNVLDEVMFMSFIGFLEIKSASFL
jgi:hypothetical protein